jgi:signal transduction histidine kinase
VLRLVALEVIPAMPQSVESGPSDARERALSALREVSALLASPRDREAFLGAMTSTVARLVGAEQAAFGLWDGEGTLALAPDAYGIQGSGETIRVGCRPGGGGLLERIVFGEDSFTGTLDPTVNAELEAYGPALTWIGARDAAAVAWRTAERPLGLLAVLNSTDRGGFDADDLYVLSIAALASAIFWQAADAESAAAEQSAGRQAELREHAERMEALEEAKTRFLNVASHELRAPLGVLQGYLAMIADGSLGPLSTGLRQAVPVMLGKVDQMRLLVTQMVEAARLEDERLQIDRVRLDLREVARRAVGVIQPLATVHHVLHLDVDEREVPVIGDANRLETVISNLVDNAIKYSPDGGHVDVRVLVDEGRAVVTVRDEGIGIRPEDMPRLFERFVRLERSAGVPGTGLGLYLARELARLHGGDIEASSVVERGAEFRLWLPVAGQSASAS